MSNRNGGKVAALEPEISRNRQPVGSSQFLAYEVQVLMFGRWDFDWFFGGIKYWEWGVGSGEWKSVELGTGYQR